MSSWHDIVDREGNEKLDSAIYQAIKSAASSGYSYEEIYTALHKMVDLQIYEYEINEIL